jgi:hypothetical protein
MNMRRGLRCLALGHHALGPFGEVGPGEHYGTFAGEASDANIGPEPRYFPLEATAGVRLSEVENVA